MQLDPKERRKHLPDSGTLVCLVCMDPAGCCLCVHTATAKMLAEQMAHLVRGTDRATQAHIAQSSHGAGASKMPVCCRCLPGSLRLDSFGSSLVVLRCYLTCVQMKVYSITGDAGTNLIALSL